MNQSVINLIILGDGNERALFALGAMGREFENMDAARCRAARDWHVIPMRSINYMRLARSPLGERDRKKRLLLYLTDGQTFHTDATHADTSGLFFYVDD